LEFIGKYNNLFVEYVADVPVFLENSYKNAEKPLKGLEKADFIC